MKNIKKGAERFFKMLVNIIFWILLVFVIAWPCIYGILKGIALIKFIF